MDLFPNLVYKVVRLGYFKIGLADGHLAQPEKSEITIWFIYSCNGMILHAWYFNFDIFTVHTIIPRIGIEMNQENWKQKYALIMLQTKTNMNDKLDAEFLE